jgi:site-specific recombinase XerD
MIDDMVARKLVPGTQRGHVFACKQFAAYLGHSPETATPDDVRSFQRHLIDSGRSVHYRNRIMTGVKFLLKVTMRRHDLVAEIYHLREPQAVAVVLAPEEVVQVLACAPSLKARVMLTIGYGCGLRGGEVTRLKVRDIDSAQGIIRVVQGKGQKDRNVMLPSEVLALLRQWWCERPRRYDQGLALGERWIFPGHHRHKPISPRQFHRLLQKAATAAGIKKPVTPHVAALVRDAPARERHRYPRHPGGARPCEPRDDGALYARGYGTDRQGRKPTRSAEPAEGFRAEAVQAKGGPARVVAGVHVPAPAGGRGHLPRARPRLA